MDRGKQEILSSTSVQQNDVSKPGSLSLWNTRRSLKCFLKINSASVCLLCIMWIIIYAMIASDNLLTLAVHFHFNLHNYVDLRLKCISILCRHNDGQMKSFYVGGPNQRKDYHIEEGEEVYISTEFSHFYFLDSFSLRCCRIYKPQYFQQLLTLYINFSIHDRFVRLVT